MNQNQIIGIVRHLLTAGGGWLIGQGLLTEGSVQELIGAIITIIGIVLSVRKNGPGTGTPAATLLLCCFLPFATLLGTGCGGLVKTTYKSSAVTNVSVKQAMAAWNDYVGKFHPPVEKEQQVKAAFQKYQTAHLAALDAALAYQKAVELSESAGLTAAETKLNAATASLSAALSGLVGLIHSFGVKF